MSFLFRRKIYSIRMSFVKLVQYYWRYGIFTKISALAETDDNANTIIPRFEKNLRITVFTCMCLLKKLITLE